MTKLNGKRPRSSTRFFGILSIVLVSFCYVVLSMVSRVLEQGFQDYTQVYVRLGLGTLVAVILFWKHIHWKKYLHLSKKDWVGVLLMGMVGYGLVVAALTVGVLNTTLINTSIIYATVPFFVYIFAIILFKRKIDGKKIILLLMSFFGVAVISSNSLIPHLQGINRGDWWVLFGAACGAMYVIGRKLVSDTLNNRELAVIVMLVATITTFLLAISQGERIAWSSFAIPQVFLGLVVGSMLYIVATMLENFGFKVLNETFASQLLMFEAVFALILGKIAYAESVTVVQLVGILLVSISLLSMSALTKQS